MKTPGQLAQLYKAGENISKIMRQERNVDYNTAEIIETAYDLQAGSYIKYFEDDEKRELNLLYCQALARDILQRCTPTTVLEAGVGEATTLAELSLELGLFHDTYGFDLSWSRAAFAKQHLKNRGVERFTICTGNLLEIPFADNSIDVVFTSHSIEPNGGNEQAILQELYRVARDYVLLLEPAYELASPEIQARMDSHGYCKDLHGIAQRLGYTVIEHRLFEVIATPQNPTAITIIKKQTTAAKPDNVFACPQYKTPLQSLRGALYSPEALRIYPVIAGIPCLRKENGIFASKFGEVV
jgi:ubiquinone/menaquinone biosynthesis C-methylase UbiE/uncharacterized protein YbaR (Trm112 family)